MAGRFIIDKNDIERKKQEDNKFAENSTNDNALQIIPPFHQYSYCAKNPILHKFLSKGLTL